MHINGEVQRSCAILVSSVKAGDKIITIEGLSVKSSHPVQQAWLELDVPQCGYCQSGQSMAAATSTLAWRRNDGWANGFPGAHFFVATASPAKVA